MKKKFRFFVLFGFILVIPGLCTFSQVSINTDASPPDPSAMLDVKSTNKGLLPPRVALTAINAAAPVTAPAIGLHVYNTATAGTPPNNVVPGNYYWNGTRWIPESPPQGANPGDMLYWNGTQWVGVPAGSNGQVLNFNNGVPAWGGIQLPIISSVAVTAITQTTATGGGTVTSDGGAPVTARGVCWSITTNPTTANSHTTDGSGTGSFTSNLTGLTANTIYYIRAYASNSIGTSYGNQLSFTTLSFAIGQVYQGGLIFYIDGTGQHGLIVDTLDQSTGAQWGCQGTTIGGTGTTIGTGQANTTAIINGCGTAGIAARICNDVVLNGYSDWYLPSKDELNQMYIQKNVLGGFASSYYWSSSEYDANYAWTQFFNTGIQAANHKSNTTYVRAIRAFPSAVTLPTITTTALTNITQNTATSGGNVTSDGGAPVTARGVCWSTTPNPTTANSLTTDGSGTGSFGSILTGLTANTLYYIRAYASNSIGTSYGNQVSFTTLSFAIGLSTQGGIIFYIDVTGQHGLIAATTDQSTSMRYAGTYTHTMALADGVGAGKANTAIIIANQGYGDGATYAARVCNEYIDTVGVVTYGDWYLPSKFELNLMYVNLHLAGLGGFDNNNGYWSSSEIDNYYAWTQFFHNSTQYSTNKDGTYGVRAVRAF